MTPRRALPDVAAVAVAGWIAWTTYRALRIGGCTSTGFPDCPRNAPLYYALAAAGVVVELALLRAGARAVVALSGVVAGIGAGSILAGTVEPRPVGAGGMVRGGLVLLLVTGVPLALVGALVAAQRRRLDRLRASGVDATGTVLGVEDSGRTVGGRAKVRLRLRLEPPGGTAFEVRKPAGIPRAALPGEGDRFAVRIDPADPSRWAFAAADGALLTTWPEGAAREPD